MANTYTQIHIQAIFSVLNRECLILPYWKAELYKYITGIIQKNNHKLLAINGMPDHIHIMLGLRPSQSISDLLQDIKGSSSKWINEKHFVPGKFSWQSGFGAFSYGRKDIQKILQYINEQKFHHKKRSFINEYMDILNEFGIKYDDRYIFKPLNGNYFVPDGTK